MKYCPECGSLLPLQTVKFCPECGCNLSLQKSQDMDIICPDCNAIITNSEENCPHCGCPADLFTKREKIKYRQGETLECPDCGKVFVEKIPSVCPECSCPSDKFIQNKGKKNPIISSKPTGKSNIIPKNLVVIFLVLGMIIGLIYIGNNSYSNTSSYESGESGQNSNYGGLGSRNAVIRAIESYIPDMYYVVDLLECKEVSSNEVEYICTVRLNATGSPISKGHGCLLQDASGRNVRGSFMFDDD